MNHRRRRARVPLRKIALLVLASLLASALLLEGLARFSAWSLDTTVSTAAQAGGLFRPDPVLGWAHTPGARRSVTDTSAIRAHARKGEPGVCS